MDHSHHHMHMDHSATPDASATVMDRCVMYMLWFVALTRTWHPKFLYHNID